MNNPATQKEKGHVVGIDIDPHMIRMIRLRRLSAGRFSFAGCRAVPIDAGLALGSDNYVSFLRRTLREFCGRPRNTDFWTALGADRVRIHHLRIPRIDRTKLTGAVYWALKREERFDEDETVVDFEVDADALSSGDDFLQVTGFLAAREDLEKVTRVFSQAGYPLTGVALSLYALRNLFRTHWIETPDAPAMFSHIGLNSSGVSILANNRAVMTRGMPIGLQSFAETLVQTLIPPPTPAQASALILGLGQVSDDAGTEGPWNEEDVFAALRPPLERMARQIERTLEYCQTTYNIELVKRVYLAGTIAANKRLTDFIQEQVSAELIVMDPFASDRMEASAPSLAGPSTRVAFTPAFGLALSGTNRTPNLICTRKDREEARKARRVSQAIFTLFVVIVAACGTFYGWQQKQLRELQAERYRLIQLTQSADPLIDNDLVRTTLADVQAQNAQLKRKARRYESVAFLKEMNALTPEYIRILRVSAKLDSPGGVNRDVPGQEIRMEGIAVGDRASLETFLTVYVTRLEQSPLLRGVEVADSTFQETLDGACLFFVLNLDVGEPASPEIKL